METMGPPQTCLLGMDSDVSTGDTLNSVERHFKTSSFIQESGVRDVDEDGNTNENNNIEDLVEDAADEDDEPDRATIESSPKGRFKRFNEELGSGAYKTVYRAIDEDTGREVAWNVIKLRRLPKGEKKRILEEINLIKNLKHDNIIHFISAWVVREREEIIFITELVTGGSLRRYLKRIKHPRLKVIKTWAREVLKGLMYLHQQETPIIHRDIKCDNVFINSNSGQIRIGDLGLSTTMKDSHAKSVLGTPEFMAPELYEEHYGRGVDIYAFGMCMLEMVTLETPYKECWNPAQVYKKVSEKVKPLCFERIADKKVADFINSCIAEEKNRPSSRELLQSEFLADLEGEENNEIVNLLPPINPPVKPPTPGRNQQSSFNTKPPAKAPQKPAPPPPPAAASMTKTPPLSTQKVVPPIVPKISQNSCPGDDSNVAITPKSAMKRKSTQSNIKGSDLGYGPRMARFEESTPSRKAGAVVAVPAKQEFNLIELSPEPRDQKEETSTLPSFNALRGNSISSETEFDIKRLEEGAEADVSGDEDANDDLDTSHLTEVKELDEGDPDKLEIVVHYEDKNGCQSIHFPFDLETDSPRAVAKEMVQELGLKKKEEQKIAHEIAKQVSHKIKGCQTKSELINKLGEVENKVSEIVGLLGKLDPAMMKRWQEGSDSAALKALQDLAGWRKKRSQEKIRK